MSVITYLLLILFVVSVGIYCFDLMGGEISIRDKEPGEAGTYFCFNMFMKASKSLAVEDGLEEGRAAPSLFRKPASFKGGHYVLLVHCDDTCRILHTWMEHIGMKV